MLDFAIGLILGLLFPNMETRWLREVLRVALPVAVNVVRKLESDTASNEDKFRYAAKEVAEVLEVAFGALSEWREMPTLTRGVIVSGLVELALFIYRVSGGRKGGKLARQAARAARRS
jgi:hypothetical protein